MRFLLAILAFAFVLSVLSAEAKHHCRHSVTGQYVSDSYAKKHPDITICKK